MVISIFPIDGIRFTTAITVNVMPQRHGISITTYHLTCYYWSNVDTSPEVDNEATRNFSPVNLEDYPYIEDMFSFSRKARKIHKVNVSPTRSVFVDYLQYYIAANFIVSHSYLRFS